MARTGENRPGTDDDCVRMEFDAHWAPRSLRDVLVTRIEASGSTQLTTD